MVLLLPWSMSLQNMKELSQGYSQAQSSGCRALYCRSSAWRGISHGNSKCPPYPISTPIVTIYSAKRMYYPQTYHHIQEIQKYNIQDYRPRMEQFQKAIRKVRQVQRMRKQRGYAFSQADESQTRVLQAYDTTRERGRYGEMASSRPSGR